MRPSAISVCGLEELLRGISVLMRLILHPHTPILLAELCSVCGLKLLVHAALSSSCTSNLRPCTSNLRPPIRLILHPHTTQRVLIRLILSTSTSRPLCVCVFVCVCVYVFVFVCFCVFLCVCARVTIVYNVQFITQFTTHIRSMSTSRPLCLCLCLCVFVC
jgi:hypothetical protein